MHRKLLAVVLAVGLCPVLAWADISAIPADWTGSRSTPLGSGVIAFDGWTDGFTVSWDITPTTESDWNWEYSYTITTPTGAEGVGELSHWVLEVSPIIGSVAGLISDTFTLSYDGVDEELSFAGPQEWTESGSNPNLPGSIYGIKFDIPGPPSPASNTYTFTFFSTQDPVWGDFYAKDGWHDDVCAEAWNSGFGAMAEGASFTDWIAVPDSTGGGGNGEIPEPASLILLVLGTSAVLGRRWMRRDY